MRCFVAEAYGIRATGAEQVRMPNGVTLRAVMMEMPLD
jgi:hypothetical protein